jgi:short-subunit dehydrogenase
VHLHPGTSALITGGGTGIGRGIALALARRSVDLALVGRRAAPLQRVAAEAMAAGSRALVLPADITDATARRTVVACASAALGRLQLLINNAGVLAGGSLASQSAAGIEAAIATNLTAAMDLTRLALPDLVHTEGAVVLVGSTMSFVPMPYAALYSASKSGLAAMGEALRFELAPLGVRLLAVYPPATRTAMIEGMSDAAGVGRTFQADAEAVGERIVRDLELDRQRDLWGPGERLLVSLHRIAPRLVRWGLATQRHRFARMMAAASNAGK